MTATDTEAALLAAVRANPGDRDRRMVYADALADAGRELDAIMQRIIAEPGRDEWRLDYAAELERTAGAVECERCGGSREVTDYTGGMRKVSCPYCSGFGCLSDGRKEFAEFIRVQCELAAEHSDCGAKGYLYCGIRCTVLHNRQRELWPAVRGAFEGEGAAKLFPVLGIDDIVGNAPLVLIRRGLPTVVRCTLAEWMGGECAACGGTRLVQHRPPRGASFDAMGSVENCPACRGTGRTPGIGPRLAQRWPIEAVEVSDKTAWRSSSPHFWSWWNEDHSSGAVDLDRLAVLPPSIFFKLASWGSLNSNMYREYDSEPAAHTALSDALLAWARGQAFRAQHENEN